MTNNNETETAPLGTVQRLRTTNDANGNPRRIYVLNFGAFVPGTYGNPGHRKRTLYIDEGYYGPRAWKDTAALLGLNPEALADLGDATIMPGHYRDLTRHSDYIPGTESAEAQALAPVVA